MSIRDLNLEKLSSVSISLKDDTSSMISHISWSDDVLVVTFKNNDSTYKYDKVTGHVFCQMMNSESIGKYFCKNIKPNYECEKVELA